MRALSLQEANSVVTPGEETKSWMEDEDAKELDELQSREYRALAARANYLALDRADLQYSVKELCRGMSRPTMGDRRRLKRLGRYLVGRPRVVSHFGWQVRRGEVHGYSDSDWAGCRRTARSTSGGTVMMGSHCLKTWSATQKSICLSSGEAELVAAVKMSTELIGIARLAQDWGLEWRCNLHVDSAAAIGVTNRRGSGKLRHIKVGMLWIQERVEEGELHVSKIRGEHNPADALTRYLGQSVLNRHMTAMSYEFRDGRADLSLQL